MDAIEREYEQAILLAGNRGECDAAWELSIGLKQYRDLYQEQPIYGVGVHPEDED